MWHGISMGWVSRVLLPVWVEMFHCSCIFMEFFGDGDVPFDYRIYWLGINEFILLGAWKVESEDSEWVIVLRFEKCQKTDCLFWFCLYCWRTGEASAIRTPNCRTAHSRNVGTATSGKFFCTVLPYLVCRIFVRKNSSISKRDGNVFVVVLYLRLLCKLLTFA